MQQYFVNSPSIQRVMFLILVCTPIILTSFALMAKSDVPSIGMASDTKAHKRSKIEFQDGDDIRGQRLTPDSLNSVVFSQTRFKRLIRLRENFLTEIRNDSAPKLNRNFSINSNE